MDTYYALVAGSGSTSRQNIEALFEDYFYANGENGVVSIVVDKAPTQSQIFVAQYAKDKNKEVVVIAPPSANLTNLPPSSLIQHTEPLTKALEVLKGEKNATAFILWSDDDTSSLTILAACKSAGLKCLDLTNGMSVIDTKKEVKAPEPVEFPEAEQIDESEEANAKEKKEDSEEEEYEEDEEEIENLEDIYSGVETIARIFAKAIVKELKASDENKS